MTIGEITPQQARARLDADSSAVYLDVRTVEEFDQGRPPGALNIPIFVMNPTSGERMLNDRFVDEVRSVLPADREIIVGCRSGGRSARATAMLMRAGYTNVVNMAGGFGGGPGPGGTGNQAGWEALSYPVETGDAGERSYQSLTARE